MRRSALAPYFSKQRIREVEPIIRRKVALLKSKMLERAETGEILNLQRVYAALSLDVISQHTLGESWEALERPDLGGGIVDSIQGLLHLHPWGRAFPFIVRNLEGAVSWILSFQDGGQDYGSSLQGYFRYQKDTVAKVVARAKEQEKPGASADAPLLEKVIRESALPDQEKTVYRMSAETNVLISAGTDTTARTLAIAHFFIISRPDVHSRLLAELRSVMPTPGAPVPPWAELERLPFLSGVVLESLRVSDSVPSRLHRVAPDEDLQYGECVIPRGTTFGQSNWFIHNDPDCFPDPKSFSPERWLGPDADRQRRHMVAFGRGTRMCLGLNLAYAEIFITLAMLVSDLDLELFETTDRDVT
jgi:cytochrome P450